MRWLIATALWAALVGGQEPVRTFDVGGAPVTVGRDGRFRLEHPGRPIANGHIILAGAGWKGSVDQAALRVAEEPVETDGELVVRGSLTEPTAGVVWDLEVRYRLEGAALRIDYRITPRAETNVAEVSLFLDLPLSAWRGKTLTFWPNQTVALPIERPAQRHFAAGRARRVVLEPEAEQHLTLAFSWPTLCTAQDCREFGAEQYQVYARLFEGGVAPAGQAHELTVWLRPSDTETAMTEPDYRSAKPLGVAPVLLPAERVPCYQRYEVPLEVTGTWDSPFDPDQIRVDAQITTPSGAQRTVPAFYTSDHDLVTHGRANWLEPRGEPHWLLRYAATEPGRHSLVIIARDRTGEVSTEPVWFEATPGDAPGYVRVSATDPRYFAFDDGRPYFAVGENVCTYGGSDVTVYDRWFSRLGAQGANYARVWMWSHCFGFDYGPPGTYRLDAAAEFDHVLELAEQHGIYIKLCLEAWRGFAGQGCFVRPGVIHPYDRRNGGPCATEMDFFSLPEARRMFRNRLRYAIGRWGYSTHLFAWEFWNEINCVFGYRERSQEMIDWTAAMGDYLRANDPWRHLIVNSLGSFEDDERLWSLPQMDFAQVHGYWHPTSPASRELAKDMAAFVPHWIGVIRRYGKPALFAEYGLVNETWGPSPRADEDTAGVHLHNGLWSSIVAGAAGTAMLWWWDNYVDTLDLYDQFGAVSRFVDDVPWTTAGFAPAELESPEPRLRALALIGHDRAIVWLQNKDHTWWNVVEEQPITPLDETTVVVPDLPDGGYDIDWWDTWAGRSLRTETATAVGGRGVTLRVPRIEKDIAVKVTRRGDR